MKHLISIIIVCSFISCSKSPQQRAEDMIREHMIQRLGGTHVYEPIEFSELFLDTAFDHFANMIASEARVRNAERLSSDPSLFFESFIQEDERIAQKYSEDSLIFYANPDSFLIMKVRHKYKIVNSKGEGVEKTEVFGFDRTVTKFYH
jgi:hypothetical protein